MIRDLKEVKAKIISAGYKAIDELIKVAEDKIVLAYEETNEDDKKLSADKMKNAAASKRIAIFDAFEILEKIKLEEANISEIKGEEEKKEVRLGKNGFAESRVTS